MRTRKYFTVREWNRFKDNDYFDMQDMLCQKYDVILTDYQTKREKIFSALKKINLRNFDKGVSEFSKLVQSFGGSMDQLTREMNSQKSKDKDNLDLVWGKSENNVPIWGDSKNDSGSKHKESLEKIWGNRK
ncbi:hypothetical protein OAI55_01705 [Nitrosopumilus sp.]|nr:hypothetical protein [Nitrosopumilus sp.]